jgi:hypothetical protein
MKIGLRSLISFALAAAIATVFTLNSLAAPNAGSTAIDPPMVQDCSGTLTVKSGNVTINGNPAQTGATIVSGSVIATSSSGKAIVDLGPLGRVELGDNTTVTVTCAGGSVTVRASCSTTEVKVNSGQVTVNSETVSAGGKKKVDGAADITAGAGANWSVECGGSHHTGGAYIGPGWWALILVGVGGGIAGGIAAGENDNRPASSPARP